MKIVSKFPVRNEVCVDQPWPVKRDQFTLSLHLEGDRVKEIWITEAGVPISEAGTIERLDNPNSKIKASITAGGESHWIQAERLGRQWQAILASSVLFDIDFDTIAMDYIAETPDESDEIELKSFRLRSRERDSRVCEFEHIGRAFIACDAAQDCLEDVAHYREAEIAQRSGRYVDAYNGFFLFLETRYCSGKTQKKEQLKNLTQTKVFVEKLIDVVSSLGNEFAAKTSSLPSAAIPNPNIDQIVSEIIDLRGLLRHHNLNSPKRWDPNNLQRYELEARLLGAVCGNILLTELFMRTYDSSVVSEFSKQAYEGGNTTKICTHIHKVVPTELQFLNVTFPVAGPSIRLAFSTAKTVLSQLETSDDLFRISHLDGVLDGQHIQLYEMTTYPESMTAIPFSSVPVPCTAVLEYKRRGFSRSGQFDVPLPLSSGQFDRSNIWRAALRALNKFDFHTPDAELLSLKLFVSPRQRPIFDFKVGASMGR